jgi:hypothetical protein
MDTGTCEHRFFLPNEFFGNKIARPLAFSFSLLSSFCSELHPQIAICESNREEEKLEEGTRIVHRVAIIDSDLYFYSPFT